MVKRRLFVCGMMLLGSWVFFRLALWSWHRAMEHEPPFYRAALRLPPEQQQPHGEEFEEQLLSLHNQLRSEQHWSIVITDQQINAWLAVDLPQKFPELLPEGVSDPRVAIEPDGIRLAFRYQSDTWEAVITVTLEPFLTDQPDELAVRFTGLRAGLVPLSFEPFLEAIREAAAELEIPIRWGQSQGSPVAVATLARSGVSEAWKTVYLESIQLRSGELYLAGRTEPKPTHVVSVAAQNRTDHH
ncbi:MAG: hypothetical protein KatS3mg110_3392 [Pirellulaceae bacterium]|nr:MAG: hypothetical protein KatS3mg110_3392 [Pirellulaceae bacterium]